MNCILFQLGCKQIEDSESVSHSVMSDSLQSQGLKGSRSIAHQAPLSMEFSRQEYLVWVAIHFLLQGILLTQGLNLGLLCPWNSLGKNTGVGCPFLLQGSKLGLLHCRLILYCLSHQGRPSTLVIL